MDDEVSKRLSVLKSKLSQLVESLTTFLDIPTTTSWPDILAQFNSLITKYDTLIGELQSASLKQLVAYPKSLSAQDPEFASRVLLRTKLIPEIENLENTLAPQLESFGSSGNGRSDENAVRAALRKLEVISGRKSLIASTSYRSNSNRLA
ncbi:hypothetical protein BC829DRAFT_403519 [Chytridium lagenaria]|nr:hypothetical protein BC829DRAFT_403519 [Chytridium lagenaria]